jgi:hypothetical protein
MICKMCYEEEAIEGEILCLSCKNTNADENIDTFDELIDKMN